MSKRRDLTGQVFGRLTVIEVAEAKMHGRVAWQCACSCGNKTTVLGWSLTSGNTKSCGCYVRVASRRRTIARFKMARGRLAMLTLLGGDNE